MQAHANEKLTKLSLTTLLKDGKYLFVEIDSLESLLMDSWVISVFNGSWEELVPLCDDNNFAWCLQQDIEYFTSIGWRKDDFSRRVYQKLKKSKRKEHTL